MLYNSFAGRGFSPTLKRYVQNQPKAPAPKAQAPMPRSSWNATAGPAPAPTPAQLPWDSIAQGTVDNANTNLKVTGGDIDAAENAAGINYGVKFGRTTDPTTGLQKIDPASATLDYSNPYSRASLLKKAYEQGQAATSGQLAERGQLYSGYMQTKLEQGTGNFNQGNSAIISDFGTAAQGLWGQRYQAWRDAQNAPITAQGDAITRHAGDPVAPVATQSNVNQFPDAATWLSSLGGTPVWTASGLKVRLPDGRLVDIPK